MNKNEELHNLSFNNKFNKKIIYDDWADTYEVYVRNLNYLGPKNLTIILRNYLLNNSTIDIKNILDFGCGTGLLGVELCKEIEYMYLDGIDISENMIKKSKEKRIYRNIYNIDLSSEKLKNDLTYDIIVSCGVFLEGHVNFSMINNLINYLNREGLIFFTIRESFKMDNECNYRKYISNNDKINILKEMDIDYLPNVKCILVICKKN